MVGCAESKLEKGRKEKNNWEGPACLAYWGGHKVKQGEDIVKAGGKHCRDFYQAVTPLKELRKEGGRLNKRGGKVREKRFTRRKSRAKGCSGRKEECMGEEKIQKRDHIQKIVTIGGRSSKRIRKRRKTGNPKKKVQEAKG